MNLSVGHYAHVPPPRDAVSKLVFELSKLPGIGEKTATRLAYHLLKQEIGAVKMLADAIVQAKEKTALCSSCFTFTDQDPCRICANAQRDHTSICVVEKPSDVFVIEQSGAHHGIYHVLHGILSPLDNVGPEDLKIRPLLKKVEALPIEERPREIILAMNPSVEGEATALYLARLIKPFFIRITKLAYGIPVGGMLEYSDRQTISRALENRMEVGT